MHVSSARMLTLDNKFVTWLLPKLDVPIIVAIFCFLIKKVAVRVQPDDKKLFVGVWLLTLTLHVIGFVSVIAQEAEAGPNAWDTGVVTWDGLVSYPLCGLLAPSLHPLGLSPGLATVLCTVMKVVAFSFLAHGHAYLAGVSCLIERWLDAMDGYLARTFQEFTTWGESADHVTDNIFWVSCALYVCYRAIKGETRSWITLHFASVALPYALGVQYSRETFMGSFIINGQDNVGLWFVVWACLCKPHLPVRRFPFRNNLPAAVDVAEPGTKGTSSTPAQAVGAIDRGNDEENQGLMDLKRDVADDDADEKKGF